MDALKVRGRKISFSASCLMLTVVTALNDLPVHGASYQTRNFSVTADRAEVAEQVGQAAEEYRRQLATFWLGKPLPNWSKPCRLRVREGSMGAGGQTTFQFVRGEVLNWDMSVQGSLERILDSVLPHEINHTIFACHFRRPLPRWADEGAATLFEHRSEQLKQLALLNSVISSDRERYSLKQLLSMKEYPNGMRPMLILYAQGFALADFLVQQKGRHAYLALLSDGEKHGWEEAIRRNFDHDGIESLERNWKGWVLAGMPKLTVPRDQMLAALPENQSTSRVQTDSITEFTESTLDGTVDATGRFPITGRGRPSENPLVRGQSPDRAEFDSNASAPFHGMLPESDDRRPMTVPPSADRSRFEPDAGRQSDTKRQPAGRSEPRRATIAAPSPTVSRDASGNSGQHRERSTELPEWLQSAADYRPAALEPTNARVEDEDPAYESRSLGTITSFESVHLPQERSVVSGSTPQWAGFPGQKKLF